MSLTSLLLAFAPTIAARFEKSKPDAEIIALKIDLADARRDLERVWVELDAERERASLWRNEALSLRHNDLLPMPMGGQHALPYAYAQNAMAQQASQQQQQAMMQQAQGQAWPEDWHCDCSPSRSAALRALVPGA